MKLRRPERMSQWCTIDDWARLSWGGEESSELHKFFRAYRVVTLGPGLALYVPQLIIVCSSWL